MKIFTIGVYNSSETHFFDKLKNNHIDVFCDIRQRRGVRGRKYAFVNSLYCCLIVLIIFLKYGMWNI